LRSRRRTPVQGGPQSRSVLILGTTGEDEGPGQEKGSVRSCIGHIEGFTYRSLVDHYGRTT